MDRDPPGQPMLRRDASPVWAPDRQREWPLIGGKQEGRKNTQVEKSRLIVL